MESTTIFLILVGILFVLAISDLIVGVSNDAVNFLNSAIGSKAAPFRVIMIVAAVGVLVGATSSAGMMEVARKGIFHPEYFYFREIMIIFLAVMITDVILLDTFNTFGLPTSTTVSIVFELLGAAVGIGMVYYLRGNMIEVDGVQRIGEVSDYINNKKAIQIIMGILLSIVVAFTAGALVQWISRLIFTFKYEKVLPYMGGIWGAIALTAITYFILIKGAKGASFMNDDLNTYIKGNASQILMYSFAVWFVIFQALTFLIKKNVLKVIVLVGTFALAMAFAGNDLVNFIGVPIAGLKSFMFFNESGVGASEFLMSQLGGEKVKTEWYLLVFAGLVMVVTLYFSKKARSVVDTTLDLSRQEEGEERFHSNMASRSIVRMGRSIGDGVGYVIPKPIKVAVAKRFEVANSTYSEEGISFDLIRASTILIVSAILISFATSLKLPLSTTYVTFMVAMGASLSDKAWGRESAVYRISGVFSVVGGWFFTAFAAFTTAFIVAITIFYGGIFMVLVFCGIALFFVIRTHTIHKRRAAEKEKEMEVIKSTGITANTMYSECISNVSDILIRIDKLYEDTLEALFKDSRKKLLNLRTPSKQMRKETQQLKSHLPYTLEKLEGDAVITGHNYVQVVENLNELAYTLNYINKHAFEHVDNNHKELIESQVNELRELISKKRELINFIVENLDTVDEKFVDKVYDKQRDLLQFADSLIMAQIKRVKNKEVGKKNSMLFMNIISETKNMLSFEINLIRAQQKFTDK